MSSFMNRNGGDCGQVNPLVDLARQLASQNDPSRQLPGQSSFSGESGIVQPEEFAESRSTFNMNNLLEQLEQTGDMNQFLSHALNEKALTSPEKLPLISNAPASIESDFYQETNHELSDLNIMKNDKINDEADWADDFFKEVPVDQTFQLPEQDVESYVESVEENRRLTEANVYRDQPIKFSSLFRLYEGQKLPDYQPSPLRLNFETMDEQEQQYFGVYKEPETAQQAEQSKDLDFDRLEKELNIKTKLTEDEVQKASSILSEMSSEKVQEDAQPKESFFYEDQSDDTDFWLKLAEDQQDAFFKQSFLGSDSAETLEVSEPLKVDIVEPLEALLDINHSYYYQFSEKNPFEAESENQQDSSNNLSDLLQQGKERLAQGEITAAILLFEAAAQQDSSSVEAWQLLGRAQAKNEKDHATIGAMKRCLALDPTNLDALMFLAIAFTNENMTTHACHALDVWLKSNPKYSNLLESNGEGERAMNVDEPVKSAAEMYQGPTPLSQRWTQKESQADLLPGNIFADGFFDQVRERFIEAALKQSASGIDESSILDPDVQCGLGVLLNLYGDYGKAADCFRAALSVNHHDHTLWNRLGATLANGGKSEEAMQAYREALQLYPGYIRARYNLAISCLLLDMPAESVDHCLSVLNLQVAGHESIHGPETAESSGSRPVTSDNVWSTLKMALMLSNHGDLVEVADEQDLSRLNRELNFTMNVDESPTSND